jgi:long-chain acyl-CoA synthetase
MSDHIAAMLRLSAERFGEHTALIAGARTLTYTELDREVGRFGAVLLQMGVHPGDRVTLYAPNSWQWVVAYHAVLRIGAVVNPVNALLTAKEVSYIAQDCRATMLIASAEKCASLRDFIDGDGVRHRICFGGEAPSPWLSMEQLLSSSRESADVQSGTAESLATVAYTSGTTGFPKGAMQSQRNILFNASMTALMHGRTREDVVVTALPCPHVYGTVVMNSTLMVGGTLVLHSKFDATAILDSIETSRATMFEGVPTMFYYLLGDSTLTSRDLTSLTRCTVGGQTMPEAKMYEVESRVGCPLLELWGMTELAGLGSTHARFGSRVLGSIGVALPYTGLRVSAVDDASRELPRGEVGELMVRGPHVMLGYFGNDEATRETIEPDGWLHTGDLARMDQEGFVYIVDRKKDMILTAGYNVYPAEIERVLASHPSIAFAAVGGVPDALKGEVAKAYVVLKPGHDPDAAAILTHCRAELAAYKVPRDVQFVADLPKTSTGKILRRELARLSA